MSRRPFLGIFVAMASLLLVAPLRAADWQTGTYTYDLSGNITAIGTHTFVYDAAGRLTSGTYGPTQKQEYTYDDFGNILTITTQNSPVVSKLAANPANNRLDLPGATFNVFAGYDDDALDAQLGGAATRTLWTAKEGYSMAWPARRQPPSADRPSPSIRDRVPVSR
jgi:YD repeat-containing protein